MRCADAGNFREKIEGVPYPDKESPEYAPFVSKGPEMDLHCMFSYVLGSLTTTSATLPIQSQQDISRRAKLLNLLMSDSGLLSLLGV